ncbi:MAG: hypothetical protein ABI824_00305 [Acidobacteriota bacterium]
MSVSRQEHLLAALQRKSTPPAASAAKPEPVREATQPPASVAVEVPKTVLIQKPKRVGKPVQFWLHEEDRKLVRELSAWLAGQGTRPTDSMVVRAALRMSKPGATFLEAYRKASLLDGRLKPVQS